MRPAQSFGQRPNDVPTPLIGSKAVKFFTSPEFPIFVQLSPENRPRFPEMTIIARSCTFPQIQTTPKTPFLGLKTLKSGVKTPPKPPQNEFPIFVQLSFGPASVPNLKMDASKKFRIRGKRSVSERKRSVFVL